MDMELVFGSRLFTGKRMMKSLRMKVKCLLVNQLFYKLLKHLD